MFHIALQIDVQKLEHEIELLVRVHNVQQSASSAYVPMRLSGRVDDLPDDVVVLEFLQQADLANGGARDTLILCFEPYFLECNDLVSGHVPRLVDDAIRSCTDGVANYINERAGNDEE